MILRGNATRYFFGVKGKKLTGRIHRMAQYLSSNDRIGLTIVNQHGVAVFRYPHADGQVFPVVAPADTGLQESPQSPFGSPGAPGKETRQEVTSCDAQLLDNVTRRRISKFLDGRRPSRQIFRDILHGLVVDEMQERVTAL